MEPQIKDYYNEMPEGVNVIDKMNEELERRKKKFIAQCSAEPNPTRERIQRDVVGAIDSIVTPKTKTSKQCAKEYEKVSS